MARPRPLGAWPRSAALAALLTACTTEDLGPDTVDPGPDFSLAEIVFDENFYYCRVEPILFQHRCGPGDPARGDAANGCHFNVTSFRLTDYVATTPPLLADTCSGALVPGVTAPSGARANYQRAQANMDVDPDQAPLFLRPTGVARHPRKLFDQGSAEAQLIRDWAERFSSQ